MTATHGKFANVFIFRKNGFVGSGRNDLSWGSGYTGTATAVFQVRIEAAGSPDSFSWRKDGGSWSASVAITGADQDLVDGQAIRFGSTSGHTVGDTWSIGHLVDEPADAAGTSAQIKESSRRMLNPNVAVTFSDSGGARCLRIDHADGRAWFDAAPATVTASGKNGFVPEAALQKAGYLYEWTLDLGLDLADGSVFQQQWKTWLPGQAEASGTAGGFFAGPMWFDALRETAGQEPAFFLLQLFSYDPDNDGSGDHLVAWVQFTGFDLSAPVSEPVKEKTSFKVCGLPVFALRV